MATCPYAVPIYHQFFGPMHAIFTDFKAACYTLAFLSLLIYVVGIPGRIERWDSRFYYISQFNAIIGWIFYVLAVWVGIGVTQAFEHFLTTHPVVTESLELEGLRRALEITYLKEPFAYLGLITATIAFLIRIKYRREPSVKYSFIAYEILLLELVTVGCIWVAHALAGGIVFNLVHAFQVTEHCMQMTQCFI